MKKPATQFNGFSDDRTAPVPVPAKFFKELLPQVTDANELKVTLYVFWHLARQERPVRFVTLAEILADDVFSRSFAAEEVSSEKNISASLDKAVNRGTLLTGMSDAEPVYFLNNARGRAALKALNDGKWSPARENAPAPVLESEQPNIFRLYEENIGPLTPLVADELRQAEAEFPNLWIEDAIRKAVAANARSWRYINAILQRRKENGAHEADRQGSEDDPERYKQGKFGDLVQH